MEENSQNVNPVPPVSPVEQTPPVSPVSNPPTSGRKPKFSLAALIGIILFLLIVGSATGFYAFKPQIMKLVSKPIPTPTVTVPVSLTPIPIVTKKKFKSKTEGFSLEYPSTWRIVDTSQGNCGHKDLNGSTCRERFILQSAGVVSITFAIHKDENDDTISCGVQSVCSDQKVTKIDYLNRGTQDEIMIVTTSDNAVHLHKSLTEKTTPRIGSNKFKDYMIDFSLPSKTGGRYVIWIPPPVNQQITSDEYFKIERVKEAMDILSTFKFTDQINNNSSQIQKSTSPDGLYTVEYWIGPGDAQKISITDKNGKVNAENIISQNWTELLQKMNITGGQMGWEIKDWKDNSVFTLQILVADGKKYQVDIDSKTGKIISSTFKSIN